MRRIFKLFEGRGDLYIVGGYVRNLLMNLSTRGDYDFATNLIPEDTEKLIKAAGFKTFLVGKAFGTISFYLDENKVEITTYRRNESYTKNNRHPIVEWGNSIEEDLARRDFKFNAIAMGSDNKIIDPFNGVRDLKNGIIDTPLNSDTTFSDDALRMLRAIMFRSRFGFKYSERVKEALHNQAARLLILPRERIVDEMNKILMLDNVGEALADLFEYRLINYFIPELVALKSIEQESKFHHKNALLHTIDVIRNSPKDIVLRWSSLFHDIGKQATFSSKDNVVHFYEHDSVGALMTYSILLRLGLPKQMVKDVTYLVRNHMRANTYSPEWSNSSIRRFIKDTGDYCDKLLALSRSDVTSHNPITVAKHLENLNDLARRIEEQRNFKEAPTSPVDGYAIMEHFDLPPCKKVAEIKALILEAIISGELSMGGDELYYLGYAGLKMEMKNA